MKIPVLDAAQSAAWDELARAEHAIPSRVLMESAGRAAAAVIAREFGPALAGGVVVACGAGNNGGDGWVVARALAAAGVAVSAVSALQAKSVDCKANRKLALAAGVAELDSVAQAGNVGVIVDALLGTGAAGPLRGKVGEVAKSIAKYGAPIAAIDGPTGLDLSTGEIHGPIHADLTITFGGLRRGHLLNRTACGHVVVVDIGFPPPLREWPAFMTDAETTVLLPALNAEMHKGERGRVVVVGGSEGMSGAAIHCAQAAFAAGGGLVKLVAAPSTLEAVRAQVPDIMTIESGLTGMLKPEVVEALEWADAMAIGPGLSREPERMAFAEQVFATCEVPIVVDAGAVHARLDRIASPAAVVTPHAGEFDQMFPDLDRKDIGPFEAARLGAERCNAVILFKGVPTIIAGGVTTIVVGAGNPALATGGSGDVLTGLIATFLARGVEPEVAAALGAQVMGRSADFAAGEKTVRATRPEDVLAEIPRYWRYLESAPDIQLPVLVDLPAPPTA
ncbi:MAG: NAD(P)H-hydrate dehydratase [Gemmatimonadales bacterium]